MPRGMAILGDAEMYRAAGSRFRSRFARYFTRMRVFPLYVSGDISIYSPRAFSICQADISKHICISGIVKQVQIRYCRVPVEESEAGKIFNARDAADNAAIHSKTARFFMYSQQVPLNAEGK